MKLKVRFFVLSILCSLLLFSCGGKETESSNDVQFRVPSSTTLLSDATSMDFKVMFNQPPKSGDIIILEDPNGKEHECSIISVNESSFTIQLYEGMVTGDYKVYFKSGSTRRLMGTMSVTVSYNKPTGEEITPDPGMTVYGQVACDGKGVSGVVVSDGIEVVVTDSKGVYQMKSDKANKYVFISIPSGYEVANNSVLPQFSQPLTKAATAAERVDFTIYDAGSQKDFTMLVLGDIHLAARTKDAAQFAVFMKDINSVVADHSGKKIYALTLGDMTWDLYWQSNKYDLSNYLSTVSDIKNLPIFHTIGNHDHSMFYEGDFLTVLDYKRIIGPTYYSFNIGDVHFVVLDDILCKNTGAGTSESRIYDSTLADEDIAWLKKDLSHVPTTTPLVVTMHAPLYNDSGNSSMSNAATLANILSAYKDVQVYTGHTHKMYNVDKSSTNHIFEHNAGAVCASWWWTGYYNTGMNISQDGTPGGYTILDVTGSDFKWQYKATGADVDYQFRSYDRNSMEVTAAKFVPSGSAASQSTFNESAGDWTSVSTSNVIYLNVWNYDPKWKVEATENGKPLTVTQVTAKDPIHLVTYNACRLNVNGGLSFPTSNTKHFFKVQATSPSSTIEITVTDRFGNKYTESMSRPKKFDVATYVYSK